MTDKAYAVPLHELLASVPREARLVIDDDDGMGTRFIPVGRYCNEAAEALRARLAQPKEPDWSAAGFGKSQPEQEQTRSQKMRDAGITRRPKGWDKDGDDTEQEPVAWIYSHKGQKSVSMNYVDGVRAIPLYTTPPQPKIQQEPICVAFIRTLVGIGKDGIEIWKDEPVYATPSKREWIGLTDEEIESTWQRNLFEEYIRKNDVKTLGRAIEAKLKEKNT